MVRYRPAAVGVLLCSLALAHGSLFAQTESADKVVAQARQLYAQEGPRAALPEFERALALYREARDRRGEAITLGYIGNCYKRFGEFGRALEHLNRALTMKVELGERLEEGKTLSHLGLVYWEMGEYAHAIDHLTRSIAVAREIENRQLEGAALNNLSLVYDEQGDYRQSLQQYQQALKLHRETNFEEGEGAILGNIGGVYLLLGQYREAMRYYRQSLAISERLSLKPSVAQDLGNLALCHQGLGQIPEALSTFDRALQMAREAGLEKEAAEIIKGKGTALVSVGKYGPALEEYQKALQVYERAGLKRELIEALNELGKLYVLLGDVPSGETNFRRAIDLARSIDHPRGVIFNLIALGDLEWRRERYEKAGALYHEAFELAQEAEDQAHMASSLVQLALNQRDQGRMEEALRDAEKALEIARGVGARLLEAQALFTLGEVERAQGRWEDALQHYASGEEIVAPVGEPELGWRLAYGRGQALEALERNQVAIAAYRQAVSVIESVRSQLRQERFRAGYIEDKHQVYVALVRLLLKVGQDDQAFLFAEKLRARSYLDLLNRSLPPVGDVDLRRAEVELRERIRQLQRAIEQEGDRPQSQQRKQALDLFSSELAGAERAYQNLIDDLRGTEPAYATARALTVPSSEEVQRRLPVGTALVEYVVGEDSVAIFVLTADKLRTQVVPLRSADLHGKVELLRDLILRTDTADWRKPAASLYQSLIDPLEQSGWLEGIERLYVVPHGILHYLPFAVLLRNNEEGSSFLMEDYVLAYLPSATALVYRNGKDNNSEGTLLAMAPERSRLRYAQQEARSIAEFFPPQPTVLVGSRATEDSFKTLAGRFRVIHLATHGYFNKLNPLLSGLELEPGDGEDGRLEVHEILGLRLQADLVTLSACDTALGSGYFAEVPAGDDFVGLTRAFLFAGSPSVLASLWEVNDRSTLRLMRSFYRHLRKSDKVTALALAQREMYENNGQHVHPYFWAPFVLVGEMK